MKEMPMILHMYPGDCSTLVERSSISLVRDASLQVLQAKSNFAKGTNAWWLAHLSSDADVDLSLNEMAKASKMPN